MATAKTSKKTGRKAKPVKPTVTLKELLQENDLYRVACSGCSKKSDVEDLIAQVFTAITDTVNSGRSVKIHGFGKFRPKTYKGRSQKSGLPGVQGGIATFGDVKLMGFKLSPVAKDTLNGNPRPPRKVAGAAADSAQAPVTTAPASPDPSAPLVNVAPATPAPASTTRPPLADVAPATE